MSRATIRVLTCDVIDKNGQCTQRFTAVGKLYWPVVQARAREAGWKHTGERHRCPAHRHSPFRPGQPDPDREEP